MVVPESSINNIMGGLESTGGVTLHNHRRKLKQRFETVAKLGQGTYGKVQLGINKETGQEVAIKTIKKCKIETEADLIRIRREIQIMSSLRHPYIIHIYEVFENRDKMVLVMEYAAGGELYDYLSKQKVLEEGEARRIFRQIAMAVYYCHKHQICHRDLKLENILLDEKGNAKIADFGLSNVFDSNRLLSTFCGSPLYASPEIVKGVPYRGPEVDCWSLGVLLYTLVYGAMPFDGSNFKRLVRQISAGEYFEPKTPSNASDLIAGLLTVKGSDRLDIAAVCRHPWLAEEGKASCYLLAAELANEAPNRLDLLLALAPQEVSEELVSEECGSAAVEKPPRSHSLSSLSTMQQQPVFQPVPLPPTVLPAATVQPSLPSEEREQEVDKPKERKRERSSSRSRRKESDDEKPKKKAVKAKKKSEEKEIATKEEMEKTLEEAKKISGEVESKETNEVIATIEENKEAIKQHASTEAAVKVEKEEEVTSLPESVSSEVTTEVKSKEKKIKKKEPKEDVKEEINESVPEMLSSNKEVDNADVKENSVKELKEKVTKPKPLETKLDTETSSVSEVKTKSTDLPSSPKEKEPKTEIVRRRSRVFEAAEMFNKNPSLAQDKPVQKKVFIPGVKVSDAKAAFERKSSLVASNEKKSEFNLASTVNVNKLIENELKMAEKTEKEQKTKTESEEKVANVEGTIVENQPPTQLEEEKSDYILASSVNVNKLAESEVKEAEKEQKLKKENAVISHAISESELNEKKASTLPRRKLSRPTPPRVEPEHMVANTKVSQIIYPAPIPPPRPSLVKQDSAPREHIIPIHIEGRDEPSEKPPLSKQSSIQSRTSSTGSVSRQDSDSSTISATASTTAASATAVTEPIRKSAREVIIPIAVEGGGFVTPSVSTLTKISSVSESEEDLPARGFGLRSTRRRHNNQLEATDSLSSDEDDDNFEMLTTENLFSALFNRMRNLTHKLNADEMRPSFPRLFNHPIFDSPSRRLMETKSFTHDDPTPWRAKKDSSSSASSSTLPRGLAVRRMISRHDDDRQDRSDLPPPGRRKVSRTLGELSLPQHQLQQQQLHTNGQPSTQPIDNKTSNVERNGSTRMDIVKRYLEELDREIENGRLHIQNDVSGRPKSPINRSKSLNESGRYVRPRSVYVPGTSQTSEFDKYIAFKRNFTKDFMTPRRGPSLNAYDRIKELREYRRSTSVPIEPPSTLPSYDPTVDKPLTQSVLEKYLFGDLKEKRHSRFLKDKGKTESRVDKAIKSLRKNSEGMSDDFSESKLLKRAVSLEDVHKETSRAARASSLKPEACNKLFKKKDSVEKVKKFGTFETVNKTKKKPKDFLNEPEGSLDEKAVSNNDRQARIANLKKLEFNKTEPSPESTPTGDFDEVRSCLSQTDNSDTWSSSDHTERYFDLPANYLEDCVSERIRRKSFYHRFNLPRKNSYHRSSSNLERKRYY
uniref:Protein kinase domain-containing protein n=1 Tax=Rhodnius prolixus TaxID=13249 RepID=A0ABL0DHA2_RHOPR